DRNRSHWSTSKTPSYTKSVSWQHHRMSLDKPVIQPSEQNRGPKDGPKAFKQLCIENPLRL
ncbi:hypothetical protein RNQ72_22935, partial [Escherichia coli]|nr:hypothetical protein [Escherichia coli]